MTRGRVPGACEGLWRENASSSSGEAMRRTLAERKLRPVPPRAVLAAQLDRLQHRDDATQIQTWINGSQYDVRGDLDLDGDVDTTDKTTAQGVTGTLGRT